MTAQFLYPDTDGVFVAHEAGLLDLTNEQYHAGPGISKSKLDAIAISPLNYWDQYENPDREPREYKHAFAVGDGTHKLVLEPGTFEQTYAVGFDKKAFPQALDTIDDLKQALNARNLPARGSKPELVRLLQEEDPTIPIMAVLEAEHKKTMEGKIALPASDYKNMLRMLQAVQQHHTAGPLLMGASVEQSFFCPGPSGVLRKCRTDSITYDGAFIVDLKTTDDVSKVGFRRTIEQRRYNVQAAWYLDILRNLYGNDAPRGFAFIAAQKTRPFDVAVHILTDDQIRLGRLLYQRDESLLIECMASNTWPGMDRGQVIETGLSKQATYQLYEMEPA